MGDLLRGPRGIPLASFPILPGPTPPRGRRNDARSLACGSSYRAQRARAPPWGWREPVARRAESTLLCASELHHAIDVVDHLAEAAHVAPINSMVFGG